MMEYLLIEFNPTTGLTIESGQGLEWLVSEIEGLDASGFEKVLKKHHLVCHSLKSKGSSVHFVHASKLREDCTGFYHKIIENSHDEIYVCDGQGVTLYCNMSFERNYGISREEIMGKTPMYMVEQGYSNKTPIPEVIRTKKQVSLIQKTITGRSLVITATPYLNPEGEIDFIIENCRDITELENVRVELENKSKEADRYKAEAESIKRLEGELNIGVYGLGPGMKKVAETAVRVARTDATLLILGESGTGKSHMAKYIHRNSPRADGPLISINCSTIAPSLFKSELFGYAAGAFTGAGAKGKTGLVELAANGTLFLDEIAEVPLSLQAKLLELIQEKRFLPVGAIRYKDADVRIIAATNQELKKLVEEKAFREDLYYRLKVVEIEMPPLRDRKDDVDGFLDVFLKRFNEEYGLKRRLVAETRKILRSYHWPGNIRELQNLVHNLVIMASDEEILPSDLPDNVLLEFSQSAPYTEFGDLDLMMETYEKAIIQKCYQQTKSSYRMAEALKISQSKAHRMIKKYLD